MLILMKITHINTIAQLKLPRLNAAYPPDNNVFCLLCSFSCVFRKKKEINSLPYLVILFKLTDIS